MQNLEPSEYLYARAGQAFQVTVRPIEKHSLYALRFAARKPAAQGKHPFFLYPALTSQRGRKNAPTLARRAGLLSIQFS
jgi:hypothetical protein